jgi:hypothetical protein
MDWLWRCTELATTVTASEPINYHVCVYMKARVYAHKVNTREKLLQRILSAARSIKKRCSVSKCYKFCGHARQKIHPSRKKTLRAICLSAER